MPATKELLQEGRYRITQQYVGNGSDTLYEAYDTVRHTNVIVKEIPVKLNKITTLSQQEAMKLAFVNHAKNLSQMQHQSLLHVQDYFCEIDRHYLVMESVEGDDLKQLLERNKSAFDLADVLQWADELLDALHFLHTNKPSIVHKNIKPENIRLGSDGKLKLAPAGLPDGTDQKNTAEGQSDPGNFRYAPIEMIWPSLDPASQKVITNSYDERSERILKEPADARSDIYALGATLYHLITARAPVDALERSIELLDGNPDPLKEPSKVNPKVPPEISDVLMKAIEIKRENRYDSAVIMRQVLKTAVVRAREREEEEMRELEEAAEDIMFAEQTRQDQVAQLLERKRQEFEEEKKREQELMERKLREAEEQRILAEKRAAEAERLLQEKDAEKRRLAEEARHARELAEAAATANLAAEEAAKLEAANEIATSEVHISAAPEAVPVAAEQHVSSPPEAYDIPSQTGHQADVVAYDGLYQAEPALVDTMNAVSAEPLSDAPPFAGGYDSVIQSSGSPFRIPMIGGLALVAILGIAGFWMFSGGTAEPTPPALISEQPETQSPENSSTNPEQIEIAQPEPSPAEQIVPAGPVTAEVPAEARSSVSAKPKKPAAKAPEKKKTVTVDDLINDN